LNKSVFNENDKRVVDSQVTLARVLARYGNRTELKEAEDLLRDAIPKVRELYGAESPWMAERLALLAGTLAREGVLNEAETFSRQALAIRRNCMGARHSEVAASLDNLAVVLRDNGRLAEAEAALREALDIERHASSKQLSQDATTLRYLGSVVLRRGNLADAESVYREALEMTRRLYGDDNPYTETSLLGLAISLRRQDKLDEVETLIRESLLRCQKLSGREHIKTVPWLQRLGRCLRDEDRLGEAEAAYREALDVQSKQPNETSEAVLLSELAVLFAENKSAEARPLVGNYVFTELKQDRLFSRELVQELSTRGDRPWMDLKNGHSLTDRWLSQQLRPYGIRPRTIRKGEIQAKGYHEADCMDVFRRYITRADLDALRSDPESPGETPPA
jgi:tetratricopeptide (TPR) repeat protein